MNRLNKMLYAYCKIATRVLPYLEYSTPCHPHSSGVPPGPGLVLHYTIGVRPKRLSDTSPLSCIYDCIDSL